MKIALYQMDIKWEDKFYNIQKGQEMIKIAKEKGAELILFPEMSFTGFSMNIDRIKEENQESLKQVSNFAKEYHITIGFGWVKAVKNQAENHYSIINSSGTKILDYIKIHPFSFVGENEFFIAGEKIETCCIENIHFSTFICYDLRFPNLFQVLSSDISVVIIPANWPSSRKEHWECLLKARAIENQIYLLGINCIGNKNNIYYSGNSCVINPNGDIIQRIDDKEGLILYDLEDDVKEFRKLFPIRQDRKKDLYNQL